MWYYHLEKSPTDAEGMAKHENCSALCPNIYGKYSNTIEPCHEKTCLRNFRPGKTQTGLHSHRMMLESWNFGFNKYKYYTI